jgi:nucleoid-associated protein YgaU
MTLGTDFDTTLTRGAVGALGLAAVWAVLVVVAVALEARTGGRLRFAERTGCPPAVRAWLLGVLVAVLAGVAPAEASDSGSQAGSGTVDAALDGLPLPDRPAGAAPPPARAVTRVVVRPGDSLWRIARERLPDATNAEVSRAVDALYADNRRSIGPDPDVIRPGQPLDFPSPSTISEEP